MTYEEYKKDKNEKKGTIVKSVLNKLFTISIFTMGVIILSNTNKTFKNFLINDVLNTTMDFSKVNTLLDRTTNVFKSKETEQTFSENKDYEEYLDGYKYYVNENDSVILKDSGIVTYIGQKDGYNNSIIIQQSNGFYALYGNINENVKLYDYIENGEVIGLSNNDFYYYVLYKDDLPIKNEN